VLRYAVDGRDRNTERAERPPHGHAGAAALGLSGDACEVVNASRVPLVLVLTSITRRCVSTHAAAFSFETRAAAVPGGDDGFKSSLSRRDIGPQRLKLFRFEEIAPWRHLALAARHRIDEAFALVGRKFPQIECRPGILHARAVTRRAVDRVKL